MHPYEGALVALLSTVTDDLRLATTDWDGRAERLDAALVLFAQVKQDCFGDKPAHFDLESWIARTETVKIEGGAAADLPEPNFVTAE